MNIRALLEHPLLKAGLTYTICDALNKAVPFLILPILSYYLVPSDYGIIANFNVLLAVAIIFITVGIDGAISVNFYRYSRSELSKFIFNALLLTGLSTVICLILILIFNDQIYNWTKVPMKFQLLMIGMSLCSVFTSINLSMWRLEEKPLKFGIYDVSQTVLNLGLSLIFVVYLKMNWIGRIDAMVIASIVFGIFSLALIYKRGYLTIDYDKLYMKEIVAFGLPLVPHSLSFWLRSGIDRIFITRFVNESATGLYATGFQFGILISFLTLSFNNAFVPYLYKMLSEKDELILNRNKLKLVKITYIIAFALFFLSLVFIFMSNFILHNFFSSKYLGAKKYIFWAILSQIFQGFYLLVVNYIFFVMKTRPLAFITFIVSLLQLFLSYFLIRSIGAMGAAYSTVIVSFLNFVLVAIFSYKFFKMPWFSRQIFGSVAN